MLRWHEASVERERKNEKENRIALASVVDHFADFQSKYGRIPKDLGEIEETVGAPMPTLKKATTEIEVGYYPKGQDFLLMYPLAAPDSWNDWLYDSTKPKAGWVEHDW